MNKNISVLLGALVVAGLAGFAGNWWGAHHAAAGAAAPAMEPAQVAAPKERKLRF